SEKDLVKLIDRAQTINGWGKNKILVQNGEIYYNGAPVPHRVIVNKIFQLIEADLPTQPLINFLENVMQNPRMSAREELYDFLEHRGLPLTEDGCFLAYKSVKSDYLDVYSGTISNKPGQVVKMDAGLVDDNR